MPRLSWQITDIPGLETDKNVILHRIRYMLFLGRIFWFFSLFFFSTGLVWLLHRRSSTEILPDYWGIFYAGVCIFVSGSSRI